LQVSFRGRPFALRACSVGTRTPVSKADTPFRAIEQAAEELMQVDHKLTREQAITKAASDNPDLYRQYRQAMDSEMSAQQPT
jgi:hypothetical protein